MLVLIDQLAVRFELPGPVSLHTPLVESPFPLSSDLVDARYRFQCPSNKVAIVADRYVVARAHDQGRVHGQFLASSMASHFCPRSATQRTRNIQNLLVQPSFLGFL